MGRAGYIFIPLAAALIVYINSFRGVFQLDDYNVIVFNSSVHSWSAFWKQFFPGIRPLLKLTYAVNWTSSPGSVFGFHVFNLGIHLINTVLAYNLAVFFMKECRTGLPEKAVYPAALLTALLFALHPIQTEAVTYISGRSASMMTMFYLGGIAAYVKGSREGRRIWLYFISPFLFLLGVATKEYAITLPFALVLYEVGVGQGGNVKRMFQRQWVHWVLLFLIIAMVLAHPRYRFILVYSFGLRGFRENLVGQANAAGDLLFHIFLPNRLNIDPGELPASSVISLQGVIVFVFAALGIAGLIIKRWYWLFFGVAWFFLNMALVVLIPRIDGISDRHFYLASGGIFLAAAIAITSFFFRRTKGITSFVICVAVISVILGAFTVSRNRVYYSETVLWEDTVKKSPSNARAYNNLGYAYYLDGRRADARKAYLRALEIDPGLEHARNNLQMLGPNGSPEPPGSH